MARKSGRKAKIAQRVQGLDDLTDKLRALRVDLRKVLPAAVMAGAEVIAEEARAKAPGPHVYAVPARTVRKGEVAAAVGPDREHWDYAFAEFGARPHEIRPRRRKALAFGSRVVKRVEHPGVPERPFLRPALDEHWPEAVAAMRKVLLSVIDAVCD